MRASSTFTACETAAPSIVSQQLLRVSECDDRRQWDSYLLQGGGGLFHRWEWKSVFDVYRLPVYRLAAYDAGRIVGVLPLVEQRSRLFGHQLVSLPWFDAAGVLARDESTARQLVDTALVLCEMLRAKVVQLRQLQKCDVSKHCRGDKLLMRLQLPRESEDLWSALSPKVRNQVRKGEKAGLQVISGCDELLSDFYDVYSHNMRDLGSPSHSRAFFEAIVHGFHDEVRIWAVRDGQRTIGAGLTMVNGSTLEIPWASSLRAYNSLCVNHLMYWRILEYACQSGYEWFHFGRSSLNSGTYRFKKQWGAEPLALHWYFLGEDSAVEEAVIDPGESFGLARRVWRRLPVCVSRRLGPLLISKLA